MSESRFEYEKRQATSAWQHGDDAGTPAERRRWLERAFRFTPFDQNLAFGVASARLMDGDAAAARALFADIATRHSVREVWCGLAAASWLLNDNDTAAAAIGQALSRFTTDETLAGLAPRCGVPWAGVTAAGAVLAPPGAAIVLDGITLGPGALPRRWRAARVLEVSVDGAPVLGSPIDVAAIWRTEGFVARDGGVLTGWAWHPGAPEADPVLVLETGGRRRRFTASDIGVDVSGASPLARPRGFSKRAALPARMTGQDGRDLWGSPFALPGKPGRAPRPASGDAVTVIVPVYRGAAVTLACIHSVLETLGAHGRVVVVNDASPEPALVAVLDGLAALGRIELVPSCAADPGRNLGFPAAVNAGLRAARGTDVVLLNSDTLVFPGWLERLRACVHGAADIGTATPLSNDATIFTYPDPAAPAPMPAAGEGAQLAASAWRENGAEAVEVPTGHGFCLYIRAACLSQTGLLREDVFAQGYGEENDFCERARARGWRHVAATGVYVAHVGGASFGAARDVLLRRNAVLLEQLHPDYHDRVQAFIAADPLAPARCRLDVARWRAARRGADGAMLLVSHDGSGGTGRVVRERADAARAAGFAPVVLGSDDGVTTVDAAAFPNLRFRLPQDMAALARLLRAARPAGAEIHHMLGHDGSAATLPARFGVPYDVWVHDWQWICPRLACVTPEGYFCGEPPAHECDDCTQRGEPPAIDVPAGVLRARSAALLLAARRVVVASDDAARRLRRHFPQLRPEVSPWQDDSAPRGANNAGRDRSGWLSVAVVGALGVEKGYEVLLACARDAAARALKLRFTVVGYTVDDEPLLETGRVFVTGPFSAGDAATLLAQTGAALAFLPSIWPEAWCYALSDAWDAGLDAAVFDIGAPAERVRRTGRGWVLPLGLSAGAINDALLRLQGVAGRSA